MSTTQSGSRPVERSTSHRLIVRQTLTQTQFRDLARICEIDHPDRFKAWAKEFHFDLQPGAFDAACVYASSEGLRFHTETTVAVSYRADPWMPDGATDRPVGDKQDDAFSIDRDRLGVWLAERARTRGVRVDSSDITFDDLHSEALHDALADDLRELTESGILRRPQGWTILVLPIEDNERWAYLAAVTPSDEAKDEGAPTFLIAEGVDEVWATHGAARQLEDIVDTANNLLHLARAARIGTDPDATHHPDGMCKAHGDYDCGEDECRRPSAATD